MKKVFFDVGALEGERGIAWLIENYKDGTVFAFEPVPEYYSLLKNKTNKFFKKYLLFQNAISEIEGELSFNIAGGGTFYNGASSLLEFNQNNIDKYWSSRKDIDLKKVKEIKVKTRRLDSIIEEYNIKNIDFLHIDAQGSDLSVLKSLGKYINIVQAGRIEVPATKESSLYKQQHTREDAELFLVKNNFKFYNEEFQENEINIYFEKI